MRHGGRENSPEVGGVLLGDLSNKPLERELLEQQLGGLLILSDLKNRPCARAIPVRLSSCARCCSCAPSCGLGCELLSRCFASGLISAFFFFFLTLNSTSDLTRLGPVCSIGGRLTFDFNHVVECQSMIDNESQITI
jgi:hypothetical protein